MREESILDALIDRGAGEACFKLDLRASENRRNRWGLREAGDVLGCCVCHTSLQRNFGSADEISAKYRPNTQTDKEIADLENIYLARRNVGGVTC